MNCWYWTISATSKKSDSESQVQFELIAHRYERGSLLITSNQAFSEWDRIFGDNMMTVAAIDRLVHHSDIYKIERERYRKKQAMKVNSNTGQVNWRRPDKLVDVSYARKPDGTIAVDIVDPHSLHLSDALPKLKGLAEYAEKHAGKYRRIESVAAFNGKLKVLALMEPTVRKQVLDSDNAKSLFESELAFDYLN